MISAPSRILVIDDSRAVRSLVKMMLPESCEVIEARDGEEGLQRMREARPELVVLDFLMPILGGWEVLQAMQGEPALSTLPLVIMSGRREEVTERCHEPFSRFAFLGKPFEQAELEQAMQTAIALAARLTAAVPTATPAPAPVAEVALAMAAETVPPVFPSEPGVADTDASLADLKTRVAHLEQETAMLRRQLAQVVAYLRQRLPAQQP